MPSAADHDLLLGPHLQTVLNSIANVLEEHGHDLLLFTRCDQSDTERLIGSISDGRVDGAILVSPRSDSKLVERLARGVLPFVVIDADSRDGTYGFRVDDEAGISEVATHLVRLGHTRIAHISGTPELDAATRRLGAFLASMSLHNLEVLPGYIQSAGFGPEAGARAMRILLDLPNRPTAVICANDEAAVGALSVALEAGLKLPQDMSITGFDDEPYSRICVPSLTTVFHPVRDIAEVAARTLFGLMKGEQVRFYPPFKGQLVLRGSTAPPRTGKQ